MGVYYHHIQLWQAAQINRINSHLSWPFMARVWKKCQQARGKIELLFFLYSYLFNGYKLAAVFRGRMLAAIEHSGLAVVKTPKKWVVQCKHVGKGLPALKYLSRYLYRGVISNKNILSDDGTFVTFRYKDSGTGKMKTRRMRGEDFVALVLQHTLPKGFRRARDYGFLHGNAKRILKIVQWVLQVFIPKGPQAQRPKFICEHCHAPMSIVGFKRPHSASG